jgi:hypothetical protein
LVKYSFYPALIVSSKKIILYRAYSGGVCPASTNGVKA